MRAATPRSCAGAPAARELELLARQPTSLVGAVETVKGERGIRPPRRKGGVLDTQRAGDVAGGTEVCQRLLWRTGVEGDEPANT